ncbi:CdaR family protein [Balneola vulgaris]|uniref:CdaR family protein n=1 Tax=Balneola vulgaris TaxID=287535 RepID=UPI0003642281|nr:hypothetical protein [Balneola vulgaris]
MSNAPIQEFKERILAFIRKGTKPGTEEEDARIWSKENAIVFVVAFIIALSLWFAVNLNGTFNITVNMPLEIGNVPDEMALTDKLPESVEVSLSGTALPLISLYNNPPAIQIDVDEAEVNIFNQVRQRMNSVQEVDVVKVEPLIVSVNLEEKISKKVPIKLNWEFDFESRYGLISGPTITPDSITITGAASHIANFDEWVIEDTLRLENVSDDVHELAIITNNDPLVTISQDVLSIEADVSEFTESEVSVYIQTRDLPRGQSITYNPASVTVKYDVPLEQFAEIQNTIPYVVYVPYQKIEEDMSGFVTPDVELVSTKYALKLRSFQPKAVAYFSVVDQ